MSDIDWKTLNAKLPYERTESAQDKRKKLFNIQNLITCCAHFEDDGVKSQEEEENEVSDNARKNGSRQPLRRDQPSWQANEDPYSLCPSRSTSSSDGSKGSGEEEREKDINESKAELLAINEEVQNLTRNLKLFGEDFETNHEDFKICLPKIKDCVRESDNTKEEEVEVTSEEKGEESIEVEAKRTTKDEVDDEYGQSEDEEVEQKTLEELIEFKVKQQIAAEEQKKYEDEMEQEGKLREAVEQWALEQSIEGLQSEQQLPEMKEANGTLEASALKETDRSIKTNGAIESNEIIGVDAQLKANGQREADEQMGINNQSEANGDMEVNGNMEANGDMEVNGFMDTDGKVYELELLKEGKVLGLMNDNGADDPILDQCKNAQEEKIKLGEESLLEEEKQILNKRETKKNSTAVEHETIEESMESDSKERLEEEEARKREEELDLICTKVARIMQEDELFQEMEKEETCEMHQELRNAKFKFTEEEIQTYEMEREGIPEKETDA